MVKSIRNLSSVTVVGLDIAKNVFHVHGVDAKGALVVAKPVRRGQLLSLFASLPSCLVGIEACSSAHHWARSLIALGHQVHFHSSIQACFFTKWWVHNVIAICGYKVIIYD